MKKIVGILVLSLISSAAHAQNLLEERIWKLSNTKKSIFLDSGIFHHLGSGKAKALLTAIRNSYVPSRGYERLVIDFDSASVPKIYGHISPNLNKAIIEFNDVSLAKPIAELKGAKFIKGIDIMAIDEKNLSLSVSTRQKASFDIFYLENPGRLVIDIKK